METWGAVGWTLLLCTLDRDADNTLTWLEVWESIYFLTRDQERADNVADVIFAAANSRAAIHDFSSGAQEGGLYGGELVRLVPTLGDSALTILARHAFYPPQLRKFPVAFAVEGIGLLVARKDWNLVEASALSVLSVEVRRAMEAARNADVPPLTDHTVQSYTWWQFFRELFVQLLWLKTWSNALSTVWEKAAFVWRYSSYDCLAGLLCFFCCQRNHNSPLADAYLSWTAKSFFLQPSVQLALFSVFSAAQLYLFWTATLGPLYVYPVQFVLLWARVGDGWSRVVQSRALLLAPLGLGVLVASARARAALYRRCTKPNHLHLLTLESARLLRRGGAGEDLTEGASAVPSARAWLQYILFGRALLAPFFGAHDPRAPAEASGGNILGLTASAGVEQDSSALALTSRAAAAKELAQAARAAWRSAQFKTFDSGQKCAQFWQLGVLAPVGIATILVALIALGTAYFEDEVLAYDSAGCHCVVAHLYMAQLFTLICVTAVGMWLVCFSAAFPVWGPFQPPYLVATPFVAAAGCCAGGVLALAAMFLLLLPVLYISLFYVWYGVFFAFALLGACRAACDDEAILGTATWGGDALLAAYDFDQLGKQAWPTLFMSVPAVLDTAGGEYAPGTLFVVHLLRLCFVVSLLVSWLATCYWVYHAVLLRMQLAPAGYRRADADALSLHEQLQFEWRKLYHSEQASGAGESVAASGGGKPEVGAGVEPSRTAAAPRSSKSASTTATPGANAVAANPASLAATDASAPESKASASETHETPAAVDLTRADAPASAAATPAEAEGAATQSRADGDSGSPKAAQLAPAGIAAADAATALAIGAARAVSDIEAQSRPMQQNGADVRPHREPLEIYRATEPGVCGTLARRDCCRVHCCQGLVGALYLISAPMTGRLAQGVFAGYSIRSLPSHEFGCSALGGAGGAAPYREFLNCDMVACANGTTATHLAIDQSIIMDVVAGDEASMTSYDDLPACLRARTDLLSSFLEPFSATAIVTGPADAAVNATLCREASVTRASTPCQLSYLGFLFEAPCMATDTDAARADDVLRRALLRCVATDKGAAAHPSRGQCEVLAVRGRLAEVWGTSTDADAGSGPDADGGSDGGRAPNHTAVVHAIVCVPDSLEFAAGVSVVDRGGPGRGRGYCECQTDMSVLRHVLPLPKVSGNGDPSTPDSAREVSTFFVVLVMLLVVHAYQTFMWRRRVAPHWSRAFASISAALAPLQRPRLPFVPLDNKANVRAWCELVRSLYTITSDNTFIETTAGICLVIVVSCGVVMIVGAWNGSFGVEFVLSSILLLAATPGLVIVMQEAITITGHVERAYAVLPKLHADALSMRRLVRSIPSVSARPTRGLAMGQVGDAGGAFAPSGGAPGGGHSKAAVDEIDSAEELGPPFGYPLPVGDDTRSMLLRSFAARPRALREFADYVQECSTLLGDQPPAMRLLGAEITPRFMRGVLAWLLTSAGTLGATFVLR